MRHGTNVPPMTLTRKGQAVYDLIVGCALGLLSGTVMSAMFMLAILYR